MTVKIDNAHVLITGANRGIGWAFSEVMAKNKAHLHLAVRDLQSVTVEQSNQLTALGARSVRVWELNLADPPQIDEFHREFLKSGVSLDVLINNAGQLTGGLLETQSVSSIYMMLQVNLAGLIHLTHLLLPMFLEKSSGVIVNNSSVSGLMYFPCATTYAASKAGVMAFNECLREELLPTGVRTILMVTPGIKTRMFDKIPELYGNFDLSALDAIPAEVWVNRVVRAIEKNHKYVLPRGATRLTLFLAQHFPALFNSIVQRQFSRDV